MTAVHLRTAPDGEQQFCAAVVDRRTDTDTWWRAELTCHNPVTGYRFLLEGGPTSYAWLNGTGAARAGRARRGDFRLVTYDAPPAWALDAVVYQIFPDRFAKSRGPCTAARLGRARAAGTTRSTSGRRRDRAASSTAATSTASPPTWTTSSRSGRRGLPDARSSPPGPTTATTRRRFDAVDPVLGGDEALRPAGRGLPRRGHAGHGRLHDQPHRRRPRVVPSRPRATRTATSATSTSTRTATTSRGSGCRRCPSSTTTAPSCADGSSTTRTGWCAGGSAGRAAWTAGGSTSPT